MLGCFAQTVLWVVGVTLLVAWIPPADFMQTSGWKLSLLSIGGGALFWCGRHHQPWLRFLDVDAARRREPRNGCVVNRFPRWRRSLWRYDAGRPDVDCGGDDRPLVGEGTLAPYRHGAAGIVDGLGTGEVAMIVSPSKLVSTRTRPTLSSVDRGGTDGMLQWLPEVRSSALVVA